MSMGLSLKNNVDADDSLRYSVGRSKPSTGLKTASLFVLLLSFYQIVYPSLTDDPHKIRNWVNGLSSFGGILIILTWSWVSLDNQEDIPSLKRHYHEGFLNSFFVVLTSVIIGIHHIAVGAEMYIERDFINDYLRANWNSSMAEKLSDQISHERFLLQVYLVIQIVVIILLFIGARVGFRSVESEEISMNRLLSLSAIAVSITSFIILFLIGNANFYLNFADVEKHFPKWLLESITCLSVILIIGSAITWLSNHQKWRVGFASGGIIVGVAIFFQISILAGAYHSALDIHSEYSSYTDSVTRLAYISENFLKTAGCPNKYTETTCKADEVIRWESGLNSKNQACLNFECLGVLGQVYSTDFLYISHALLFNLLAVGCLLGTVIYFWHTGLNPTYKGDKKNSLFGIFMIVSLIVFVIAKLSFEFPHIETYQGDATKLKVGNYIAAHKTLEVISDLQGYEDFNVDDEIIEEIFSLVFEKTYKYLFLRLTKELNGLEIVEKRYFGSSYDDFYETLKTQDYTLGLIWLTVESEDRLFIPIYIGPQAPPEIQQVLEISDDDLDEIQDDDTIGFVLTSNLQELTLDNLLQKRHKVFRTRDEPTFIGYYEAPLFAQSYRSSDVFATRDLTLPSQYFDEDLATKVNWMAQSSWYTLIVTQFYNDKLLLEGAYYDAPFSEVRTELVIGDLDKTPIIFFYLFTYENVKRPIAIILSPQYLWGNQIDVVTSLIDGLNQVAIPVFPLEDKRYFDLDYLITYGCIPDPEERIAINNDFIQQLTNY